MRKSYEELNEICKQNNIDKLWSWSRINSWHTSHYEYYLKYIKKEQGTRKDSCYLNLGSTVHELMELYYTDKVKYEDLITKFEDSWFSIIDIAQLKFDRNDSEKNENIQNKYHKNLVHYFKNFIPIKNKTIIEQFVTIKITPKIFLQGYIDVMYKDDDGILIIEDFKTSTIYTGDKKLNECGQLVLYALGIHQKTGLPLDKIKIGWNFLKYVHVDVEQKNGKIKERNIERSKLGESLKASAKTWLKTEGYSEEEIKNFLTDLVMFNNVKALPEEVQKRFVVDDCRVFVDLSQDVIDVWTDYVEDTVETIEKTEKKYKETNDDKLYYDDEINLKVNSYYYSTLSEYSITQLKPYKEYLDKLEKEKSALDSLFLPSQNESEDKKSNATTSSINEDLSWLDEINI